VRTADSTIIIITNFYLAAIAPTKLGFLVTKPLTRYDKLFGAKGGHVTQHEATSYHKNATSVVKVLDRAHELQAKENRKRLEPIVKTIILCGRQNIALCGHRDDGKLVSAAGKTAVDDGGGDDLDATESQQSDSEVNEDGNFRACLQFRTDAGVLQLQRHLSTASNNATYISKTSQNDLIASCAAVLTEKIAQRVRQANFLSSFSR